MKRELNDLIKEAILRAYPTLEVVRADEIAVPGAVTTDILTRIMHSDYVVADVTYQNPNVFYELGLRHACRPGTIIIRDKKAASIPFDIAHLRYIEYENTATGLKQLANNLESYFQHIESNVDHPDNQFLELAKLTEYKLPDYSKEETTEDAKTEAMLAALQSPEILEIALRGSSGEKVDESELMAAFLKNPDIAGTMLKAMVKSGEISFEKQTQPRKPVQRKAKSKKRK